ncbi:MAG: AAA family ATPase [SAR324 cluster bacterium]|nr:AAA family ATPase [SAR324 cluster bacterium]
MFFSNYRDIEEIFIGPYSVLYKGIRTNDELPVVIRVLKKESSLDELASLQSEAASSDVSAKEILRPIEYLYVEQHLGFVYKDVGMIFLRVLLQDATLNIENFLELAISIAGHLSKLHKSGIIHRDLTPGNILVSANYQKIRFIGFYGFEKMGKKPLRGRFQEDVFFAYTSPEVLGEQAEGIDLRADLYSLGVLLYELLSGHLPFEAKDPVSRKHAHLALRPASLLTFVPDLPPVLGKIVEKLLEKIPAQRYQSAKDLSIDLQRILRELKSNLPVSDFIPGSIANRGSFLIPNQLYGAKGYIEKLHGIFDKVSHGKVEVVLVAGKPGFGKTTLIESLVGPVGASGGYFVQGRFEKIHRDTPYFALQSTFQALVNQVLAGDEATIARLKEILLTELGKHAQIMVNFLPDLEFIIGKQLSAPEFDTTDSQKRFLFLCSKFLNSFSLARIPLAIFLDNFHWSDSNSLLLLQSLLTDLNSRFLLVILAFREGEFYKQDLLDLALDEAEKVGVAVTRLEIAPLTEQEISVLLDDALGAGQDFGELAKILLKKTGGNPFFIKQLLQSLYDQELLVYDDPSSVWVWDSNKIQDTAFFEDILELMSQKVKKLPKETYDLLVLSSCLGLRFDLKTLSWVFKKNKGVIFSELGPAIEDGMIVEEMDFWDSKDPNNQSFHFAHSRILQATNQLLEPVEKKQAHYQIGKELLAHSDLKVENDIFTILGHLDQALSLIQVSDERHQLAKLNLRAGIISKSSAAYETAWRYFTVGVNLLGKDSWEQEYELTKALFLRGAESEYYVGNTEAVGAYFTELHKKVKTKAEQLEVVETQLNLYIQTSHLKEAVDLGIQSLDEFFNFKIPPNEAELKVTALTRMQSLADELDHRKIDNLLHLPLMNKGQNMELLRFIAKILPAAYINKRSLWILLTIHMVRLSMEKGNCLFSALAYMNLSVLLCSGLEDYPTGHSMASVALQLDEKFKGNDLESQLSFLFGAYISHWQERASDSLHHFKRSYKLGINSGDLHSASSAIQFLIITKILTGQPLEELQKELTLHSEFSHQVNDLDLNNTRALLQIPLLLKQEIKKESQLQAVIPEQALLLEQLKKSKNHLPLQWYYLVTGMVHYHFGQFKEALKLIRESDLLIAGYSQLSVPEHYFYYSLILLANYPDFSLEEKKRSWEILKNNRDRLKKLSKACPINFLEKYYLVAAEMAVVTGNVLEAMNLFEEAISAVQNNQFVQNEALIFERAGLYFLSKKKKTIAKAYLREAYYSYVKWGASAKVWDMESKFPSLLKVEQRLQFTSNDHALESNTPDQPEQIDLATLYKAFESISLEASFDKVIVKLFKMVMENAGAQKGYFIVEQQGKLIVRAKGSFDSSPPVVLCSFPAENSKQLSFKILSYVQRTGQRVLFNDAMKENIFGFDSYIQQHKPKSILALPLLYHNQLKGILYLENNLTTQAFSHQKAEFLRVLASLVSITLENSSLYSDLAQSAEELGQAKQELEERILTLESQLESKTP